MTGFPRAGMTEFRANRNSRFKSKVPSPFKAEEMLRPNVHYPAFTAKLTFIPIRN
jgi:hypothetical protein